MTEDRPASIQAGAGGLRQAAARVVVSSLLVAFCFASELQLFEWDFEIPPERIALHEADVYSVDLQREPFGIVGFRFTPGDTLARRLDRLREREGFTLRENAARLGPSHVLPANLSLGGGRFLYLDRTLYFTATDDTDPRTSGRGYAVVAPLVVDRPLAIACVVVWLLCLARLSRAAPGRAGGSTRESGSGTCDRMARASLRWHADDLVVFLGSFAVALAYALGHPELSIPHGPLAAGVGIQDARMWDDAALVFASGAGYAMAHRPGYPLLLGSGYALFGVSPVVPLALNLLAFAGTALLVYRSALALFGRAAAVAAVLLLHTDVVRLDYVQVGNTDILGGFLTACFVYTAFALLCGRQRSLLQWFVLGLLLGLANLVKTMTLPAVIVVLGCVAVSKRHPGWRRKSLAMALVTAGLLAALAPWQAYRNQTQGATELGEKGAIALYLATSPDSNIDGKVDRGRSRQLRERGSGDADLGETVITNLRDHWAAYLRNIVLAFHRSIDTVHFSGRGSALALLLGFCLVVASGWNLCPDRRALWILGSGGALAVVAWSLSASGLLLPFAVVVVASIRRRDLRLFLLLASVPLVVTSMLGMGGSGRQLIAVTWIYPIVAIGCLALAVHRFGEWLAAREAPGTARRIDPEIDWPSLGIVAGFVLLAIVGALRIQLGGPGDGILAREFTMAGRQLWALPTSEFERRQGYETVEEGLACDPERFGPLLRDARRVLGSVPDRPGARRRILCFRAYTGRHLYRVREGQRGKWHRHRPFIFDRTYERTIFRDQSFVRVGGRLPDGWADRVVHVVGVMGRNDVFNAVILEDVEPSAADPSQRDRIVVADPRHLSATRNGR